MESAEIHLRVGRKGAWKLRVGTMTIGTASLIATTGVWLLACDSKSSSSSSPSVQSAAATGAAKREFPQDSKAHDVLRRFSDHLSESQFIQVDVTMLTQIRGTGVPEHMREYEFYRDSKSRAAVRLTTGVAGPSVVCDGRRLYVLEKPGNRYLLEPAPSALGDVPTKEAIGGRNFADLCAGMAPLFQESAYAYLARKFEIGRLLPDAEIEGVACHRIEMAGPEFERILWIERGERPVLRRVTLTQWERHQPNESHFLVVTSDFRNWRFDEPFPESVFEIRPPADAKRKRRSQHAAETSSHGTHVNDQGNSKNGSHE